MEKIEHDMVIARSQFKLEYIIDQAKEQYPTSIENLNERVEFWENKDIELIEKQNFIRSVGLGFRKLGRANNGKLNSLKSWRTICETLPI
jgi:hypothetical protein